eukprot:IDg653t1
MAVQLAIQDAKLRGSKVGHFEHAFIPISVIEAVKDRRFKVCVVVRVGISKAGMPGVSQLSAVVSRREDLKSGPSAVGVHQCSARSNVHECVQIANLAKAYPFRGSYVELVTSVLPGE